MAEVSFLNDNAYRDYPFKRGLTGIPDPVLGTLEELPWSVILDFGCTINSVAAFDPEQDTIYLYRVTRSGSVYTFDFRSTASGLTGWRLLFCRDTTSVEYAVSFSEASAITDAEDPCSSAAPLWSGYLATGSLTALGDILSNGEYLTGADESFVVEPSTIVSLNSLYARTLNTANKARTKVQVSSECDSLDWPYEEKSHYVRETCKTGDVKFHAGYNAVVKLELDSNSVLVGAGVKAGEGEPCGEVNHFDDEAPPTGRSTFSGRRLCSDYVLSINGITGKAVNVSASKGILLAQVPAENKIRFNRNLVGLLGCGGD